MKYVVKRSEMMKKYLALVLGAAMIFALGLSTVSYADESTYTVAIAKFVDDASLNQIETAIINELAEMSDKLGIVIEVIDKNGNADSGTLNQMAVDFVDQAVDVIIPIATPAAVIMQAATEDSQIPVVFSAVSDPEGAGLVVSNDAPCSNVTGTSDALNTEAVMNLITAANPEISRIGFLYSKSESASEKPIAEAKAFCEANGIEYIEKSGNTADEVIQAAQALIGENVEAVFTPTDNTVMTAELNIYEDFLDAGIPHYCGADSFALNGAFCGYGVNYADLGTATADMVVDILVNGSDPASTPVQMMDNGIATVNTETAAAIGLDYSMFSNLCDEVRETVTAKEFTDIETEAE